MVNIKISKIFTVLFILFFFSGCKSISIRGQYLSNEVSTEKPSKEQLIEMIGNPTYIPDYTNDTWYYIQRSITSRAWFSKDISEQRVVKIVFNNSDRVKSVELIEDGFNDIKHNSDYTETPGTTQNGLQKFIKNLGRFNKTTDGASKRIRKK